MLLVLSKRFSNEAFPQVASWRVANFLRDTQAESSDTELVSDPMNDQTSVTSDRALLEDAIEIVSVRDPKLFWKTLVRN